MRHVPHEQRLKDLLGTSDELMNVFLVAKSLNLPNWYIGAGAIRNFVWNHLHGYKPQGRIPEIDLVYFDSEESEAREREVQTELNATYPDHVWDVTNQARVHEWYPGERKHPILPFLSVSDGVASWPEVATCVAAKLHPNLQIEILAPYGLDDLFTLRLTHNPRLAPLDVARTRIAKKQWLDRWPKLCLCGELRNAA